MNEVCSKNGKIIVMSQASIPLNSIEAQYGFGVYETIKVRNNNPYFVPQHIERLLYSASCIGLEHTFTDTQLQNYVSSFLKELKSDSCNLKVLMYGSSRYTDATVYILASAPFYPHRKWHREGVSLMSYQYERWMPQAKTLNMVASYYIYTQAQNNNCYDALLINQQGEILEGTRTNVYLVKDKTLISPPKDKILEGVTMKTIEKVLSATEYRIKYQTIKLADIKNYDGMFLSSTSSKILPVSKVDDTVLHIPYTLRELIDMYEDALEKSAGNFDLL